MSAPFFMTSRCDVVVKKLSVHSAQRIAVLSWRHFIDRINLQCTQNASSGPVFSTVEK